MNCMSFIEIFLVLGLSLMLVFIAKHYCLLVLRVYVNNPLALADLLFEKCFTCALKDFLLWGEKHLSQWYWAYTGWGGGGGGSACVILLYLPAGFRSLWRTGAVISVRLEERF